MQNFSEDYMVDYVLAGEIALPGGETPEPFVDADDIADVAVAALTDDKHVGELYELTGPRPLTFTDVAEELSTATGRDIRYVPVSIEEFAAAAAEQGMPAEAIDAAHVPVRRGPRRAQLRTRWTASSAARSGASRGTSASSPATPPPPACWRRPATEAQSMIEGFLFVLTLVTAIACGLVAGFFFAFSAGVMKALARLPAAQGWPPCSPSTSW